MNSLPPKSTFPYRWFRWVAPVVLFGAAIFPIAFMLLGIIADKRNAGWSWQIILISLFLMIIPLVSAADPIIGGVLGLIAAVFGSFLAYILAMYMGFQGSFSSESIHYFNLFFKTEMFLLIVGSLISIIYGIIHWIWRRKKRKHSET